MLADPIKRLTALFAAIVLLVGGALTVAIALYDNALDDAHVALRKAEIASGVRSAATGLGRLSRGVEGYAYDQDPVDLKDISGGARDFDQTIRATSSGSNLDPDDRGALGDLRADVTTLAQIARTQVVEHVPEGK